MIKTIDDFKTCPFCNSDMIKQTSSFYCQSGYKHSTKNEMIIYPYYDTKFSPVYLEYYLDSYLLRASYSHGWLVLHNNHDIDSIIVIFDNFNWGFDPYNIEQTRNKIKTWITFS